MSAQQDLSTPTSSWSGGATVVALAREVGPVIDTAAPEIERIRDLPECLFNVLIERDLFRLLQPQSNGGAQISPLEFVSFLEEIGKHDASTGWCLCQNNVCSTIAALLEPRAVREVFASPRDILAWGPGPGEARVVPGGFRLSGQFSFASGSRHATWLGAHVPVIETDGSRRPAADGSPTNYTMLFPRSSARVNDTWQVIGLKGTGSDSFEVDDLLIPDHLAVARHTATPRQVPGNLYKFTSSTLYSSGFAAVALGIARSMLDAFVSQMRDTLPRGAAKTRGDNNVVQSQVGQAEARIRSSRMHLFGSLEQIWERAQADGYELTRDDLVTLRLATTWAIQQSREVVASLYMAAGALAIFESQPFERRFRDIHTLCQQIQGHAAHFETVGQILMGKAPDRSMFTF